MAPISTGARQRTGALLECLAVVALMYGVRPAARSVGITTYSGPIAIVLVMVLATVLLARRGESWRSLGLARPPDLGRAAIWTVGTFLVFILFLPAVLQTIADALALPPQDLARLGDIQHDTTRYLVLLIPIGWGTAAFGEELIFRGFLNTRMAAALGGGHAAIALSVVLQAVLFGLGHAYLGPRGSMNAAAIGLVSGGVYWANGRNLWPLVIAHGLVDSVGLTMLRLGVAHQG
jgi:membrane protease YdiL (CAAX protease family)